MSGIVGSAGSRSGVISETEIDYEEGTWTITGSMSTSGTVTLDSTYNKGRYLKVGNLVHVQGDFRVDAISSPVGTLRFSLPFTTRSATNPNAEYGAAGLKTYSANWNSGTSPVVSFGPANDFFSLYVNSDDAAVDTIAPGVHDWYTIAFSYVV